MLRISDEIEISGCSIDYRRNDHTSILLMSALSQQPARFLSKLREILSKPDQYGDCITWVQDGKAIEILDEKEFANSVLLENFQYANFKSFIRQLNVYGFRKTRRNLNERIYYNPHFNKHQPELTALIKRKPRNRRFEFLPRFEHNSLPEPNMPQLPSIHQLLENLRRTYGRTYSSTFREP